MYISNRSQILKYLNSSLKYFPTQSCERRRNLTVNSRIIDNLITQNFFENWLSSAQIGDNIDNIKFKLYISTNA